MKARGTATDKLADVIQVLQMAYKTGLLTVTRDGSNDVPEQGAIKLRNGQIVDAITGALRGVEAFNRLMTWRTCHFVFQPSLPTDSSPLPVERATRNETPPNNAPTRVPSGALSALRAVPYRIRPVDDVLPYFSNLGLSRAHRQLFLLIDGKRTVHELTRLFGHQSEIDTLLADLARTGLIGE